MKTLYVHIGTHKTATTAIQHFCKVNKELFKTKGCTYPLFPQFQYSRKLTERNGLFLTTVIYDENGERDMKLERKRYWAGLDLIHERFETYDTVILSDESLWRMFWRRPHRLQRLVEDGEANGYRVVLILYLRRQDEYIESLWQQRVKRDPDFTKSFWEFVDEYPFLDYYEVLQKLSDIVGRDNMIVRRFEDAKKVDGGILADFLSQVGLELTDEYEIEGGDVRNTSLTGNTLRIKKTLNELDFIDADDNVILRESLAICTGASRKEYPCSEFSPEERTAFMKAFEESNARIADEFIGDGQPLFSTDYKNTVKREDDNPFLIDDIIRASASADVLLDRQIREMRAGFEARIAELESRVASLESSLSKLEAATDKRFQKVDRRLEKHDVRIDHLRHPLQALRDRSK